VKRNKMLVPLVGSRLITGERAFQITGHKRRA
jgi:hypothetical protein